jgi:hypothetical protein
MSPPVLFLTGCMGTRIALVLIAAFGSRSTLRILSIAAGIISIGFLTLYLFKLRKTGIETGGKPIWWNDLRPVHAALYAAVAFFAWNGRGDIAWKILAVDVTIGFVAFVIHYQKRNVTFKAYKDTLEP